MRRVTPIYMGAKPQFRPGYKAAKMEQVARQWVFTSHPTGGSLGVTGGERSYAFVGLVARLERALQQWTMRQLVGRYQFTPMVVPNLLYDHVIENCGFPTRSVRSQVYTIAGKSGATANKNGHSSHSSINHNDSHTANDSSSSNINTYNDQTSQICIAGTSEFALVAFNTGNAQLEHHDLPKKYCALSRCYRAETSETASENGLYRVHYFNKIEMVALTDEKSSESMLEHFVDIQCDLYQQLGLHFRVLDMPKEELGLSAVKKYDIEGYMAGRDLYGEISSASNCTDYQSSRLNIQYSRLGPDPTGQRLEHNKTNVHTINGTACASTRLLMALIEHYQRDDGNGFTIPKVLRPYMDRYLQDAPQPNRQKNKQTS